ncbi:uncharacterized protein PAC_17061 [Phialocephala subalpina]|uniref:Integral membrane protein n=1 Tax=Phialocephala subalpina TaxID=576137 RepID=A0A1L7XQ32_9HELO|nr:uncharacterized protein PAC_17061 [Phialocephala subalpina]
MSSLLSCSLVLFLLAPHAQASSFKPNCTIPPPDTSYVSGPNVRGTTSILWNCLSIIFLCTWNIQHLNVPAQRPKAKGVFQGIWWAILDSRKKIKWMIFTMLVPEYLVGKAFGEKLAAKSGVQVMEDNARKAGVGWDEIHAYMANMGYFVVNFSDVLEHNQADKSLRIAAFENIISQFEGKFVQSNSINITLQRFRHRCWALNSNQLRFASSEYLIDMPNISSQELQKLDRGDKLAKVLALIQITYLIVQLIARRVLGLPSTQLEIAALAFSASSLVTYVLYWSRPQGVDSVHVIKAKKLPDDSLLWHISDRGPAYLWTNPRTGSRLDEELDLVPLPNDGANFGRFISHGVAERLFKMLGRNLEIVPLAVGAVVGGTLFGGLHCLAWNFQFPTLDERLAWRVCSILTSSLPIVSLMLMVFWLRMNPRDALLRRNESPVSRFIVGSSLIILLLTYILARLFLMVEIFRSLFYLPPEAFIDTWSGNFPHFG